jgi:hypothetical protein
MGSSHGARFGKLKLRKKVEKVVDEAGFNPCTVRDSVAVPLLQAALLEDEETLQDKWANLLANAACASIRCCEIA